jgi:hypothetical protein
MDEMSLSGLLDRRRACWKGLSEDRDGLLSRGVELKIRRSSRGGGRPRRDVEGSPMSMGVSSSGWL